MYAFQKLEIYKLAKDLTHFTYAQSRSFPASEQFVLVSQMTRAALSIPSNIAEGSGRVGHNEKLHYLSIAYASLMELTCQFEIAFEQGFVTRTHYDDFCCHSVKLSIKINNYREYLRSGRKQSVSF